MWLTVAMLVTSIFWPAVQAEINILRNGLPENCGKRLPLKPPPENYDGSKTEAQPHSWPWHVGLYYSGYGAYPFCGGSLISPTWVLTAAHCIKSMFACKDIPLGRSFEFSEFTHEELAVKVGSHNYKNDHRRAYNVLVKHVIIHPNFLPHQPKEKFDYALLKLTREVKRSKTVEFACLPEPGLKFKNGKVCYGVGWGLIALSAHEKSPTPDVLMEKPVTIAKAEVCERAGKNSKGKNAICVQESIATLCSGDSGGGLQCPTEDGTWTLYGVFWRSPSRCYSGVSIFSATDPALTWIKTTIQAYN